jgi:hypothetical protein
MKFALLGRLRIKKWKAGIAPGLPREDSQVAPAYAE